MSVAAPPARASYSPETPVAERAHTAPAGVTGGPPGAAIQEAIDVAVILNALRAR